MQEAQVLSLGQEDPLEEEMATHPSIPAWEIPWTEDPGELQSTGSQRVGRDSATKQPNSQHYLNWLQVILLAFQTQTQEHLQKSQNHPSPNKVKLTIADIQ